MNDEDLLVTNNINIEKLLEKKKSSKYIYDKDKPEFLDNVKSDISENIQENYLINQQLNHLASVDKKKKIKKTYINIDSRNRQIRYSYNKDKIQLNKNHTRSCFIKTVNFFM